MSLTQTETIKRNQNYTTIDNEKRPINIIATNLIKCTHCGIYVNYEELAAHSQMHVPVQMRDKTTISKRDGKGISGGILGGLKGVIEAEEEIDDICVRSLLPEEMPQIQEIRKQPKYVKNNHKSTSSAASSTKSSQSFSLPLGLSSISPNQAPASTLETLCSPRDCPESIGHLNFKKVVNLHQNQICETIKKQQIKYYTKQHDPAKYVDTVTLGQKTQSDGPREQQGQKEDQQGYLIQKVKKQKEKQDKDKENRIRVQIRTTVKQPIHKEKISTISTSGSGFYKHNVGHKNQDNDSNQDTSSNIDTNPRHLQCQNCHGFYCKACGSDIPPIFRPVGNNSLSPRSMQASRQFYLSHVFNGNNSGLNYGAVTNRSNVGKTSRATGCTNCE